MYDDKSGGHDPREHPTNAYMLLTANCARADKVENLVVLFCTVEYRRERESSHCTDGGKLSTARDAHFHVYHQ